MNMLQRSFGALRNLNDRPKLVGRLFRKYVALFLAVVCVALVSNGLFEFYFLLRDYKTLLGLIQRAEAETAAGKIKQFVAEIEGHIGWTTQLPWTVSTLDDWRFDAARLFRQVPAITEFTKLDMSGREQLQVSRIAPEVVGSQIDYSQDPKFLEALRNKVHYGRVHFRRESEPYMTIASAGASGDSGVSIAEVNLTFIRDVVSKIKVTEHRTAYVVDSLGRLIAHPDISLVLRNLNLSHLEHVRAALASGSASQEPWLVAKDIQGQEVLTAHAPITPLGWQVFVDLPLEEAYAPFYGVMLRSGGLLLMTLGLAALAGLLLTRKMMAPIQALHAGVARIGGGDLSQRISIKTGDELEALGDQFNSMAARASRNPIRVSSARSRSARVSSSSPISPSRVFLRLPAMICASRCTPLACSSPSCAPTPARAKDAGSSSGSNPGSTLYGMARFGGSSNIGTLFKIGTDGTGFDLLHIFRPIASDRRCPQDSLIQLGSTLYGTTSSGGSNGEGTIFKIGTDGTGFSLVHSFAYSGGYHPAGSLIYSGSTFYGLGSQGGRRGYGTVLRPGARAIYGLVGLAAGGLLMWNWPLRRSSGIGNCSTQ